jgi:hypothetical protein
MSKRQIAERGRTPAAQVRLDLVYTIPAHTSFEGKDLLQAFAPVRTALSLDAPRSEETLMPAAVAQLVSASARDAEKRILLESTEQTRKVVRVQGDIRIADDDDIGLGVSENPDAGLQGFGDDSSALERGGSRQRKDPNPVSAPSELRSDVERVIGGTILDDDPAERSRCLPVEALGEPRQISRLVSCRGDEAVVHRHAPEIEAMSQPSFIQENK